jgi:hypothetical protein
MFLRFKQLFRKKDYRELMVIARSGNVNLSLARLYLRSIVSSPFSIEYDEADIKKAKEMIEELEKVEYMNPDEIQ